MSKLSYLIHSILYHEMIFSYPRASNKHIRFIYEDYDV